MSAIRWSALPAIGVGIFVAYMRITGVFTWAEIVASGAVAAAFLFGTKGGLALMAPRVGRATAWAAVTVIWFSVWVAATALSGPCAGDGPACSPRSLAGWGGYGALLLVLYPVIVVAPVKAAKFSARMTRPMLNAVRSLWKEEPQP